MGRFTDLVMRKARKEYGLVCNYSGDASVRRGAKCYVTWTNPGEGGDRMQVWCRSRGGRAILKIVNSKKLSNFRAAWIPAHVRTWEGVKGYPWWTKDEAVKHAQSMNQ